MEVKEILTQILINYGPAVATIATAIGSAFAMLKSMKNVFKKSNIDDIRSDISQQADDIADIKDITNGLAEQNALLRQQNEELINALNKVSKD